MDNRSVEAAGAGDDVFDLNDLQEIEQLRRNEASIVAHEDASAWGALLHLLAR